MEKDIEARVKELLENMVLSDEELVDVAETIFNFKDGMTIQGIKEVLWQLCRKQAKQVLYTKRKLTLIERNEIDEIARFLDSMAEIDEYEVLTGNKLKGAILEGAKAQLSHDQKTLGGEG